MALPPFEHFPKLMNEDIILREATAEDAADMQEIMTYNGKYAESAEEVVSMFARIHTNYLEGTSVSWIIADRKTLEIAGTIGYYRGFAKETGEIGFILREDFRGKGYMSAAIDLVTAFGKDVMKLERIIAITKSYNINAQKLLERNSFVFKNPLDNDYYEYELAR